MQVDVPTPDFTMPYNVITLTSSVVTFFVGSMFNLLARKRRLSSDAKPTPPRTRRCSRCRRLAVQGPAAAQAEAQVQAEAVAAGT